ncbi:MAG: LytTR family DNA-binding domain-containing protein [Prolixibacteraceae bacterium]|jgi:DNA-binding LytR/AlgR family response regulator|nr:LytTR family DNA-binding domain-containing protein [Prolixibacteraceae bacterium]
MKTKINCIIADDEPLSQDILKDYVENCPELGLKGVFPNALQAREAILNDEIQLVFLDINMPGLSGINLVKSLSAPPLVIFVTAYPEHAVEGFDLDAVDYLLKPVSYERFLKAVNRAIEKLHSEKSVETSDNHIMVKADKKMFRINLSDIFYIEAQGDYIKIHTAARNLMAYGSLSAFEEKLPSGHFLRIHKSYIVALPKIEYIEGNQIKIKETLLPVSRKYHDELLVRLNG